MRVHADAAVADDDGAISRGSSVELEFMISGHEAHVTVPCR